MTRWAVAVFSYNRGAYLRNCVDSLRRNMPMADITIHDDRSDDPDTLAVLAEYADLVRQPGGTGGSRHGGLYANMQAALEATQADYLLFLQEDMQIVRPVSGDDLAHVEALFDADPRRAFVSPLFIKGVRLPRHKRQMQPDPAARAYVARPGVADAPAYFDVSIGHVGRLRVARWRYQDSEAANVAQARQLFGPMPILGDPFAFFCPEVPIFRNRGQSLAARIAARLTGPGVRAFNDMTADQVAALCARPLTDWPVAEAFLTPRDPSVRRPFVYKDVKVRWWLAALHKIEETIRRR